MIVPDRRMKQKLRECEERCKRKAPFRPGKYRRNRRIKVDSGKI